MAFDFGSSDLLILSSAVLLNKYSDLFILCISLISSSNYTFHKTAQPEGPDNRKKREIMDISLIMIWNPVQKPEHL